MSFDKEELDEFLSKVEDANRTIDKLTTGEMTVEEFDQKYKRSEIMQQIREQEKKEKEQKAKIMGREGKGEKDNYKRFCKACFREYELVTNPCVHCGKETISREERKSELLEKVEALKEKKRLRAIKKARWENWMKTQALFYKKTATNYKKWDYYEEESDEEEKEPILPKDDPNFRAMEADIKVRSNKRKADRKRAIEYKQRGNQAMKKGLYVAAEKLYSDGLENSKEVKELWTNRALARLKLEKFELAMDDCSRVLEYCQVLQEGFQKSKDICFKGFMRRGMALRGQGRYFDAVKDFQTALTLYPGNEEAEKWLKRTQEDHEMELKAQKILENKDSLTDVDFVDKLLETLQDRAPKDYCSREFQAEDQTRVLSAIKGNQDLRLYFIKKKGLETLLSSLTHSLTGLQSLKELIGLPTFKEQLQKVKAYQKLIELLWSREMEETDLMLSLEILQECSLNQFVRNQLSQKKKVKDVFLRSMETLTAKDNAKVITMLFSFVSNLCYSGPKFKEMLRTDSKLLLSLWQRILKECGVAKQQEIILVDLTVLSLIGNFTVDTHFRGLVATNSSQILDLLFLRLIRIRKESPTTFAAWNDYVERICAIFINCSVGTGDLCLDYIISHKGVDILSDIFKTSLNSPTLAYERCLSLASKLCRSLEALKEICSNEVWVKGCYEALIVDPSNLQESASKPQKDSAIKIFATGLRQGDIHVSMEQYNIPTMKWIKNLKLLLADAHSNSKMDRFVNICAAFSAFVDHFPDWIEMLREVVPLLIQIAKEKVDILRKNAAILLAKLAKNEKLQPYIRELHGIEVLMAIGGQVMKNN